MKNTLIMLLFLPVVVLAQTVDSIKVDHTNQVQIKSTETVTAGIVKEGDTLYCFEANDLLKIGYDTAVRKGAVVMAIVRSSKTEHKVAKEDRALQDGFVQMYSGGILIIDFVAVKAVDDTWLPFGDCNFTRYGGDNGGLHKGTPAFMPKGSYKTCSIKWPGKKIAVVRY
jgi:hypothetical protein